MNELFSLNSTHVLIEELVCLSPSNPHTTSLPHCTEIYHPNSQAFAHLHSHTLRHAHAPYGWMSDSCKTWNNVVGDCVAKKQMVMLTTATLNSLLLYLYMCTVCTCVCVGAMCFGVQADLLFCMCVRVSLSLVIDTELSYLSTRQQFHMHIHHYVNVTQRALMTSQH